GRDRVDVGADLPPPPLAGRRPARSTRPRPDVGRGVRTSAGAGRLYRSAATVVRDPLALASRPGNGPGRGGRRRRKCGGAEVPLRWPAKTRTVPPLSAGAADAGGAG